VRDAVATATATDLRSANVEDDALPSVSVIFFAVTPTSPEAGAVDDPTGRGGGVEAGGGDSEVTTLDPNHPARSGDDDNDDALPSASVFVDPARSGDDDDDDALPSASDDDGGRRYVERMLVRKARVCAPRCEIIRRYFRCIRNSFRPHIARRNEYFSRRDDGGTFSVRPHLLLPISSLPPPPPPLGRS
jgi:hypothetical protein